MEIRSPERVYYMDWLRVLGILVVFVFHNAHIFDPVDFHVKNRETGIAFFLFVIFANFWMMPLFFFLAGGSSKLAYRARSSSQYILERVKRLIIPFMLGIVVLVPPQDYVEVLGKTGFSGSYMDHIPFYIKSMLDFNRITPMYFGHLGHHVWFLAFLFIFSVITIPMFRFLMRDSMAERISKLAAICSRPGMVYVFALLPMASYLILRPVFPAYCDWADFVNWFFVYVSGFIAYSCKEFEEAFRRHIIGALITGVVSFGLMVGLLAQGYAVRWFEHPDYSPGSMLFQVFWVVNTWSWMIVFIGLGAKFLNFKNRFLAYAGEAVLPFYILHQTVVLMVGYYITRKNINIYIKFVLISVISFVLIMGIYQFIVRRLNIMRLLFGMKAIKKPLQQTNKNKVEIGAS